MEIRLVGREPCNKLIFISLRRLSLVFGSPVSGGGVETGKARRGGAGRTAVRFLRHFENKNSKNVSIFEVRSRFERENGNFESEERGTVNDFINLLLRVIRQDGFCRPTEGRKKIPPNRGLGVRLWLF